MKILFFRCLSADAEIPKCICWDEDIKDIASRLGNWLFGLMEATGRATFWGSKYGMSLATLFDITDFFDKMIIMWCCRLTMLITTLLTSCAFMKVFVFYFNRLYLLFIAVHVIRVHFGSRFLYNSLEHFIYTQFVSYSLVFTLQSNQTFT